MICISTMHLVFFAFTVLMLVLMIEVQKGCNGVVDTCILRQFQLSVLFTYPNNLQTKGVQITEDAL